MPDYAELLNTIKQAAIEAVDAKKPVQICFGKVINISPLQILIDQKIILDSSFLVLTKNVTYFNKLEKGEEVILLRMQGGQKYIVLDMIGGE